MKENDLIYTCCFSNDIKIIEMWYDIKKKIKQCWTINELNELEENLVFIEMVADKRDIDLQGYDRRLHGDEN